MTREDAIESNEDTYKTSFVLDVDDETTFSKGQCYEEGVAKKLICKCGCDKMYVGQDSHFTIIKCPECGNEEVIHDG